MGLAGAGKARRAAAGWRGKGETTALVLATTLAAAACGGDSPTDARTGLGTLEADAGSWRTWLLASGEELRPPPPPAEGSDQTRRELEQIRALQQARTDADERLIARWRSPTRPWSVLATDLLEHWWPFLPAVRTATPVRAGRIMALLHVAMYDAMVATWDAKFHYDRLAPSLASRQVRALAADAGRLPSYPSEHAAAGAAAAAVLAYAFPLNDSTQFHAMAEEAGRARVLAGAAYPSDVEAGAAIGRAVAARVLEFARTDGSAIPWTGTIPEGPGLWRPTRPALIAVPFDPLAGDWRTWVLPSGDVFLSPPPPDIESAAFQEDLDEVLTVSLTLTPEQAAIARFWATDPPSLAWEIFAREEATRRGLGPMHAIRARALISVATYDAFIACWQAKYHYWLARPVSMNPDIVAHVPTPPFPSYPSGHSTQSAAAAEVFAALFPDAAEKYHRLAEEASISRLYGGFHYRFDLDAGHELGRQVGLLVVERARTDGSTP